MLSLEQPASITIIIQRTSEKDQLDRIFTTLFNIAVNICDNKKTNEHEKQTNKPKLRTVIT